MAESGGRRMGILFAILLADLLAFTSILPLFPAILEHYSEAPDGLYRSLDATLSSFKSAIGAPDRRFNAVFFGGLLGSLFSFLQFLSSPIVGALSDAFGRKPLLLLSVAGTLVSYIVWARAATFSLFVLSRILGGVSKASVSIATAIVADIYDERSRSKGMAAVGVAFSVGFMVGPSIGAYFASGALDPFVVPAYFSIVLTLVELALIVFALPETLPAESRKASLKEVASLAWHYINPSSLFAFHTIRERLSTKDLDKLVGIGRVYFLYLFLYSGLEFTLGFFTRLQFGYSSAQQGRMYLAVGVLMMIVQGGYVRRLGPAKAPAAVQAGMALLIPAFALMAAATGQGLFYAGLSLYSIGSGMIVPCATAMASAAGPPESKGAVLGTLRSLGALARALGPIAASAVFWAAGPSVAYGLGAVALLAPLLAFRPVKAAFLKEAKTE